jgi:hypothetical protein
MTVVGSFGQRATSSKHWVGAADFQGLQWRQLFNLHFLLRTVRCGHLQKGRRCERKPMTDDNLELIRHRRLRFDRHTPEAEQAVKATELLSALEAVVDVSQQGPFAINVAYDLRRISLFELEEALVELGLALDRSLRNTIRRRFFRYTEDIERGRFTDCPPGGLPVDTRRVFMNRYRRHRRGCRDTKPRG